MGGYQHIHGADHLALALQEGANLAIAAGSPVIKRCCLRATVRQRLLHEDGRVSPALF